MFYSLSLCAVPHHHSHVFLPVVSMVTSVNINASVSILFVCLRRSVDSEGDRRGDRSVRFQLSGHEGAVAAGRRHSEDLQQVHD